MQYLLHDLLRLPLEERLIVIEKALNSIKHKEESNELKIKLAERFKNSNGPTLLLIQ